MAMVEAIWPSEQLAAALSNPPETKPLDPADPQVNLSALDMTRLVFAVSSLARALQPVLGAGNACTKKC